MTFDVSGCALFRGNATTLTFFESVIAQTATPGASVVDLVGNAACFHQSDLQSTRARLLQLTGLTSTVWPMAANGLGLEVYRLYLKEDE